MNSGTFFAELKRRNVYKVLDDFPVAAMFALARPGDRFAFAAR